MWLIDRFASIRRFLHSRSGAVSVDFVVLTAAVAGLATFTAVKVMNGEESLAQNLAVLLSGQ